MKAPQNRNTCLAMRLLPLVLCLTGCLFTSGGVRAQSLTELYDAVRSHDSAYLSARLQHEANLASAQQSRSGVLPKVGVSAEISRVHADNTTSAPAHSFHRQNAIVSAQQPLYRPAQWQRLQQAALLVEASSAQLVLAEQDMILRLGQAYFEVLSANDALSALNALKSAIQEQLNAARMKFKARAATVTDTHEAQARFDLVLSQEIAAKNDLLVRRLHLDQLVGTPHVKPLPLAGIESDSPTPPELAQIEDWLALAVGTHPAIVAATRRQEVAEIAVQIAQAGHKPTLDLVGSYQVTRNPHDPTASPGRSRSQNTSIGLQFTLPLFAGHAVQNQVKEAIALEDKARADRDTVTRRVIQDTRQAFFGLQTAAGQVRALKSAEISSKSALEGNLLEYQLGARINVDVLNAQSQFFQAKRDLAQARYKLLLDQLRLKGASGQLGSKDLGLVDALIAPPVL